MPVNSGSAIVVAILEPWRAIGPTIAISENVFGVRRSPTPCPVAGASTTTKSYGAAPLVWRSSCASSHTLPMLSSSRMPGVAIANALNILLEPSICPSVPVLTVRYSSIAPCGSIEIVYRPGASSSSEKRSPSCSNARWTCSWLASSTTIVRSPWRAASIPSAVATVDLPTPPLPVTNSSR